MVRSGSVLAVGREAQFSEFMLETEPKLRRAFVARYGTEQGSEASSEAFAWAWEHWDQVGPMINKIGYLYRVGQSRIRPRRWRPVFEIAHADEYLVEPSLASAVARIPERQRVATMLIFGAGWTNGEVAALLGINPSTAQRHAERGLEALRRQITGGARS